MTSWFLVRDLFLKTKNIIILYCSFTNWNNFAWCSSDS